MKISIIFRIYILILIMTEAHLLGSSLQFLIDYPRQDEDGLVEGRVLLLLSQNDEKEPRFQITDNSIIPLKERVVDEYYDPVKKLFRKIFKK